MKTVAVIMLVLLIIFLLAVALGTYLGWRDRE